MDHIDEVILKVYKEVIKESEIEVENIDLQVEATRENGLDSLGIVNFVLGIEDELDINLDDELALIRTAKTLKDVAEIIRKHMASNE